MLRAEMYEDLKEYLNWYDTRSDVKFAKDAPVIGLVLQRSHLVTGDEGHYSGVVMEMEARGAKVLLLPTSSGILVPITPPPPPLSLPLSMPVPWQIEVPGVNSKCHVVEFCKAM